MTNEEAKQLLEKYNAGLCTEVEKAFLENWYLTFNEHEVDLSVEEIDEIAQQIYTKLPIHNKAKKIIRLWTTAISVAAILILAIATWQFYTKQPLTESTRVVQDIRPGGNRAILTLTNGHKINLNDAKTGLVINGTEIKYLDGTMLNRKNEEGTSGMQTLTTPRGGQYQIILPDGTKVWLNAASSLSYPISFEGKAERRVTLTGEAYFEVEKIKGARKPFIITTVSDLAKGQTQEVEVLGTHFNINAYNPLHFKTTLLEGSVKVSIPNSYGIKLKPGEQSVFSNHKFEIKEIDADLAIAWKNGKTAFESADIQMVMLLLTYWYDIDVKYEGKLPGAKFSGSVSRSKNISSVLELLESTNDVHFKIKGREITVMN